MGLYTLQVSAREKQKREKDPGRQKRKDLYHKINEAEL